MRSGPFSLAGSSARFMAGNNPGRTPMGKSPPPLYGPSQRQDETGIEIASGVSTYSGDAFVTLSRGDRSVQLTAGQAREHALAVLAAAAAAEYDSIVFAVLRRDLDDDGHGEITAGRFLINLHDERARRSAHE